MFKINVRHIILLLILSVVRGESVAERYGDRITLLGIPFKDPFVLCQMFIAIFLTILFFQSGLDKFFYRKENKSFFDSHFAGTFLQNFTGLCLTFLALLELTTALILLYGIYFAFIEKITLWIFYGFVFSSITMIVLFFGQRIAKDYVGAADLVPYFILIMLGIMSMY